MSPNIDAALALMGEAFPRGEVEAVSAPLGGQRARLSLPEGKAVKYAYMNPMTDGGSLRLFPADTLTQARLFYADPTAVKGALGLAEVGWQVQPNFHFGFMQKGLARMRSKVGVEEYMAYWMANLSSLRALQREEWDGELRAFMDAGVTDERDFGEFERAFVATRRKTAVPRPGLRLSRKVFFNAPHEHRTTVEVRDLVSQALTAIKERWPRS